VQKQNFVRLYISQKITLTSINI